MGQQSLFTCSISGFSPFLWCTITLNRNLHGMDFPCQTRVWMEFHKWKTDNTETWQSTMHARCDSPDFSVHQNTHSISTIIHKHWTKTPRLSSPLIRERGRCTHLLFKGKCDLPLKNHVYSGFSGISTIDSVLYRTTFPLFYEDLWRQFSDRRCRVAANSKCCGGENDDRQSDGLWTELHKANIQREATSKRVPAAALRFLLWSSVMCRSVREFDSAHREEPNQGRAVWADYGYCDSEGWID